MPAIYRLCSSRAIRSDASHRPWIVGKALIGGNEEKVLHGGLSEKQPIERIAVQVGQARDG